MLNFAQSKHNTESASVILGLPAFFAIMSKNEHLWCLSFRQNHGECRLRRNTGSGRFLRGSRPCRLRMGSATTMADCKLMCIEKKAMMLGCLRFTGSTCSPIYS